MTAHRRHRTSARLIFCVAAALTSCKDDTTWHRDGSDATAGADATAGTWTPPTGGYGQAGGFGGADAGSPTGGAVGLGGTAPQGGQGGAAPSGGAQVGPDAGAGGDPARPFDCAVDLPPVATLGEPCDSGDACGPGGVCAGETLDTRICLQMCVPGACEDSCAGTRCRAVVGPDGQPVEIEAGVPLGACALAPPPGEAFAPCSVERPCGADLDCVALTDQETQQCLPRCGEVDTPCDAGGLCAAGGDAADPMALHCLLPCAAAEDCPAGTTCAPFLAAQACVPAP